MLTLYKTNMLTDTGFNIQHIKAILLEEKGCIPVRNK